MEALFERAIGDDWSALHPRLRERYGLVTADGHVAVGRGHMRDIRRSALAIPLLALLAREDFLFPEAGRDVGFSITTEPFVDERGNEALVLRREFQTDPPRTIVDTLRWNPARGCVTDLFGRHGLVAADVHLGVADRDLIISLGTQWLRAGRRYLRLPGFLAAGGSIRDAYDEGAGRYLATASITAPVVGEVFGWAGHFTHEFRDRDAGTTADATTDTTPDATPAATTETTTDATIDATADARPDPPLAGTTLPGGDGP